LDSEPFSGVHKRMTESPKTQVEKKSPRSNKDKQDSSPPKKISGIKVVTEPSKQVLNDRQLVDYRNHREKMIRWVLNIGKNPSKAKGYAVSTAEKRLERIDRFYRWIWEQEGYTTQIIKEHGDDYVRELVYSDYTEKYKANMVCALKTLYKWLEENWEPEFDFSPNTDASNPREYLTRDERKEIREIALEYKSIPSYSNLSRSEREQWKTHLAQRFRKPREDIIKEDWERANSWKIPSLVWVSLDAGLRPVEVERATVDWVDIDNQVLRIPKEESSKNTDNWVVALRSRTVKALEMWLNERENYSKYDNEDTIWLTREGNPYQSQSLRYLLHNLCEEANIPINNRRMSWYAIRHSTGTGMANERGLAAAQQQLRHKSQQTTMKYDQAPVEDRKEALDHMG
jgi:integrase